MYCPKRGGGGGGERERRELQRKRGLFKKIKNKNRLSNGGLIKESKG